MGRFSKVFLMSLAAVGLLSGCGDGASNVLGGDGADLSADMEQVALESDLITEELLSAELDGMAAPAPGGGGVSGTDERTFNRTRSCPAGGELSVSGTILRTFDAESGVMEAQSSGNRTRTDCAFVRNDLTITVNGSSEWEHFRRRVDGQPDGPQTSHYVGSWTAVRSDGEERSCTFEYSVVRDPDSRTRTVEGTMCGKRMHRGVGWGLNE